MPLEDGATRPSVGRGVALPVMDSLFAAVLLYSFQFVLWRNKQQEWTPMVWGDLRARRRHAPLPRMGKRAPVLPWQLNVDVMTRSQLEAYHRKCEPEGNGRGWVGVS